MVLNTLVSKILIGVATTNQNTAKKKLPFLHLSLEYLLELRFLISSGFQIAKKIMRFLIIRQKLSGLLIYCHQIILQVPMLS